MASQKIHRGHLLLKVAKASGIKIITIAQKAGYSRESYYNHIEQEDLSINILFKYGTALNYDFSTDIPEVESLMLLDHKQPATLPQAIKEIERLKIKYYDLLEKYNDLLEKG